MQGTVNSMMKLKFCLGVFQLNQACVAYFRDKCIEQIRRQQLKKTTEKKNLQDLSLTTPSSNSTVNFKTKCILGTNVFQ